MSASRRSRIATPFAVLASVVMLLSLVATPAYGISQLDSIGVGDAPAAITLRGDGAVAFVANRDGASVSAITLSTQAVTTIPVGFGPADLSMRPGTNELWVLNYATGSISIINAITFTETTSFLTAGAPQGIVFSPSGARAYVTFPLTDQVKVYDTATRTLVTTWSVGDVPQGIAPTRHATDS